jgi:hypothetical protein
MATTTTNFGWDIPQSTDLVKDGATAIAALGQDIDTAMVDLKGGTTGQVLAKASGTDLDFSWVAQDDSNAIQNAIVDAKGDLIGATAADTPARLAVGANGTVLTADSTAATGLKWDTVAAGGMTLLSTTTLSGSSTAISVTPTGYTRIEVLVKDAYTSANDSNGNLRLNADTGNNYAMNQVRYDSNTLLGLAYINREAFFNFLTNTPSTSSPLRNGNASLIIYTPNDTDNMYVEYYSLSAANAQSAPGGITSRGIYNASAALSNITLYPNTGTWSGGTVLVYGVK